MRTALADAVKCGNDCGRTCRALLLDPHNPGYLLDILPPSNVPAVPEFTEPRWRRQYETLCRLGARQQPKVSRLLLSLSILAGLALFVCSVCSV